MLNCLLPNRKPELLSAGVLHEVCLVMTNESSWRSAPSRSAFHFTSWNLHFSLLSGDCFTLEVLCKQGPVPHAFNPASSQEIKTERLEVQRWILSQILRLSSGNGLVISTKVVAFSPWGYNLFGSRDSLIHSSSPDALCCCKQHLHTSLVAGTWFCP